jgi:hypothetical protein
MISSPRIVYAPSSGPLIPVHSQPAWKVWRMFYRSEPRIAAGQAGVLA